MNLDLTLRMESWSRGPEENLRFAREAESLGYRSVWTEEAYGNDAVVPLAWIAAGTTTIGVGSAIWQIPGRSPATAAMTAATLDLFSGGRFRLGLGVSGPQVVEGWHGCPFDRPLQRTREYVAIIRQILRRDPVEFRGDIYSVPVEGRPVAPVKLILHPHRARLPVYVGALGPKNVELTAEIADGWLPIFMAPSRLSEVFGPSLARGFQKRADDLAPADRFDIAPTVQVVLDDDAAAARDRLRPRIALYIGGMGSKRHNFSNDLISRLGYEEAATQVRDLYLEGHRRDAIAAVPDALIDDVALCGPPERIADRLAPWTESDVTTIVVDSDQIEAVRVMAEVVL